MHARGRAGVQACKHAVMWRVSAFHTDASPGGRAGTAAIEAHRHRRRCVERMGYRYARLRHFNQEPSNAAIICACVSTCPRTCLHVSARAYTHDYTCLDMPRHMSKHMSKHMRTHRPATPTTESPGWAGMYLDMCLDMCLDMRLVMCLVYHELS